MASLNMLDAKIPLLELKVYIGSRADAERAAKALENQADDIYKQIIDKITDRT